MRRRKPFPILYQSCAQGKLTPGLPAHSIVPCWQRTICTARGQSCRPKAYCFQFLAVVIMSTSCCYACMCLLFVCPPPQARLHLLLCTVCVLLCCVFHHGIGCLFHAFRFYADAFTVLIALACHAHLHCSCGLLLTPNMCVRSCTANQLAMLPAP